MTVALLELQRARNRLAAFCRRHNVLPTSTAEWRLHEYSDGFLLSQGGAGSAVDAVRLQFTAGRWLLSVPAPNGWRPYPPRPAADDIESVIDELEQAPLHVHWG
jgi:hypothetical protein